MAILPAEPSANNASPGFDDRTVVASAQRILTKVKPEAGLLNIRPMAGVTFLCEQRLNVLLVVNFPGGGWR